MERSIGLIIVIAIVTIIQIVAIIYAAHLIRRTKYNLIWILCIVGFLLSLVQHFLQLFPREGHTIDSGLFIALDIATSLCIVLAVLFANRLVNYLDRLNHQRALFNKRIMTAVLRTEERSRSTFAKELHDSLGPLLSSVKMSLSALPGENLNNEEQELLKNTRNIIDEAIRSVRELSNNMSPQILVDFGLAQGVQSFITRIGALHKAKIDFQTNLRKERFDNDIEVILYRVICEFINNSLKHSGCSEITISLQLNDDTLKLDYADNGKGFQPRAVADCGMGLSNIVSRIDSLNGELDIRSSKGKGMQATVAVSLKQNLTTTKPKKRWQRRLR